MKIAIIGAGAAGLMCALNIKGHDVTVFDRLETAGNKLRATGNGRGNVSNIYLSGDCYNHHGFASNILKRFDYALLERVFNDLGILLRVDEEGRAYPIHERIGQVVDIFKLSIQKKEFNFVLNEKIDNLVYSIDKWIINDNEYDLLVLATGGKSSPRLGSDGSGIVLADKLGHTLVEPIPGLCSLKTVLDVSSLDGTRAKVIVSSGGFSEKGEIIFRSDGISGIVIFNLSRQFRDFSKHPINIDFLPDVNFPDLVSFLKTVKENQKWKYIDSMLDGILDKKIAMHILASSAIDYRGHMVYELTEDEISTLAHMIKATPYIVYNGNDFQSSQVTMGGIPLEEVNENFQSLMHDRLYVIGEMLDIDGKSGGYNLHMAFATGYLAAEDINAKS